MSVGDGLRDSLDVYEAEWQTIQQRRFGAAAQNLPVTPPPRDLTGLALSGGGIRSATFNLGMLQAFHRGRLLDRFDYLSTVSGGGYVGGWWSAWLARSARASDGGPSLAGLSRGVSGAETEALFPEDEGVETWRHHVRGRHVHDVTAPPAPDPIHHVRLFSNYLTPRKGALSPDLWRAITIAARNLMLTWAALLPFLAMAVVLSQAVFLWIFGPSADMGSRVSAVASLPLAFLAWFGLLSVAWLLLLRGGSQGQWAITIAGIAAVTAAIGMRLPADGGLPGEILAISTLVIGAAAVRVFWPRHAALPGDKEVLRNRVAQLQSVALIAALATAIVGAFVVFGPSLIHYLFVSGRTTISEDIAKYAAVLLTAASTLHTALTSAPAGGAEAIPPKQRSTVSRVLLMIAPSLTMIALLLGLVSLTDWASRSLDAAVWTPAFRDASLIGTIAMMGYAMSEKRHRSTPLLLVVAITAALAAGNVAHCAEHGGRRRARPRVGQRRGHPVVGLRSSPGHRSERPGPRSQAADAGRRVGRARGRGRRAADARPQRPAGAAAPGHLRPAVHDASSSSDGRPTRTGCRSTRSTRCASCAAYLGASNPRRTADEGEDITETMPDDDILLSRISGGSGRLGPYHLINATLNMTTGSDLVIAQRAAAPFLFSRHFCGSARTGFRRSDRYRAGTLTLGTAVAVSGAAASPVMGSQTPSTATSMLLAFLNVRLGYWLPTPGGMDWEAPQARFWPFYLLREFFSHLADTGSHCYVTDGGHFDNTGVYSLVERGCQTIVLTDCGADPDFVFDDLANLVRRCRIDFGAEITFPSLAPFSRATLAADRKAYVRGDIHYSRTHLRGLGWDLGDDDALPVGTLLVVKPTLTAALETDINRYSQQHADFPQQTTADQWFDEAQFESYRRLGEQSGAAAVAEYRSWRAEMAERRGLQVL